MKILAKVGAALITVGAIVGIVGVLNGGWKSVTIVDGKPAVIEKKIFRFDVSKFDQIEVNTNDLDVDVVLGNDYGVKISSTSKEKNVDVDVHDGTLEVEQTGRIFHGLTFGDFTPIKLTITVLRKTDLKNLKIHTNHGEITLNSLTTAKMDLKANTGDIEVYHVAAKDSAKIITRNGEVLLNNSEMNNIVVQTTNADIDLNGGQIVNGLFKLSNSDFTAQSTIFTGNNTVENRNGDNEIDGAQTNIGYILETKNGDNTIFGDEKEDNSTVYQTSKKNIVKMTTLNGDNDVE